MSISYLIFPQVNGDIHQRVEIAVRLWFKLELGRRQFALAALKKKKVFETGKKLFAMLAGLLCTCIAIDAFFIGCELLTVAYGQTDHGAALLGEMFAGATAPFFWMSVPAMRPCRSILTIGCLDGWGICAPASNRHLPKDTMRRFFVHARR